MQVGEVVKARVISADPASRRLSLSLVPAKQAALAPEPGDVQTGAPPAASKGSSKPVKVTKGATDDGAAIDPLGGLQPGDIVQGQVVQQQTQVRLRIIFSCLCSQGCLVDPVDSKDFSGKPVN